MYLFGQFASLSGDFVFLSVLSAPLCCTLVSSCSHLVSLSSSVSYCGHFFVCMLHLSVVLYVVTMCLFVGPLHLFVVVPSLLVIPFAIKHKE